MAAVGDVAHPVAGLDLANGERALVEHPAYVEGLAVLALPPGHGAGRYVSAGVGDPGAVEVAQHLVLGDGVFRSAPRDVGGAVAGQEFAGDEATCKEI